MYDFFTKLEPNWFRAEVNHPGISNGVVEFALVSAVIFSMQGQYKSSLCTQSLVTSDILPSYYDLPYFEHVWSHPSNKGRPVGRLRAVHLI